VGCAVWYYSLVKKQAVSSDEGMASRIVVEGQAVIRATNQESTVAALEAEYRAWADHFKDAIAQRMSAGDVSGRPSYLLKGFVGGIALFPRTRYGPGRFALRYTSADPWERDWFNVGQDLYSAILRYRMADQSSARDARETEPSGHPCSR
jgi:hypothetical protein